LEYRVRRWRAPRFAGRAEDLGCRR
jgi:hypothetical protein